MDTKNSGPAMKHRVTGGAALPLLGTLLLAASVAGPTGCKKDESHVDNTVNELHDVAADAKDKIRDEAADAKARIQDQTRDAKEDIKDAADDQP